MSGTLHTAPCATLASTEQVGQWSLPFWRLPSHWIKLEDDHHHDSRCVGTLCWNPSWKNVHDERVESQLLALTWDQWFPALGHSPKLIKCRIFRTQWIWSSYGVRRRERREHFPSLRVRFLSKSPPCLHRADQLRTRPGMETIILLWCYSFFLWWRTKHFVTFSRSFSLFSIHHHHHQTLPSRQQFCPT